MLLFSSIAAAGVVSTVGDSAGTQLDVIGITGFTTLGSDMAGLQVTATYAQGGPQMCIWAATSATAGGCDIAGVFSISQDGDTFTQSWTFQNMSTFDSVQTLVLNGNPLRGSDSGVVFDRTFGGVEGTDASALGADADGTTTDTSNGSATYSDIVAVMPDAPVGDIFAILTIRFDGNGLGPGQSATFVADTDTIGLGDGAVPEPGTVGLLALGLLGIAAKGLRLRRS
jgi:hypothetical protein